MRFAVVSLMCVLASFSAWGGESPSYLCVAEESTGFYFSNGKWGRADFNIDHKKFIIRRLNESEQKNAPRDKDYTYGVIPLGENRPTHYCESPGESFGNKLCNMGVWRQLLFSPDTKRYLETNTWGYWIGKDTSDNTPHITRGRCSQL